MRTKLVTAPARQPVTLAEAKIQCRVDIDDDNELISDYINAATIRCQHAARRTFISTTYDGYFDSWPCRPIEFPFTPLQSVTGVYYTDEAEAEITWASSNYLVDLITEPGRLKYKSTAVIPSTILREVNGVRVRFVAGYGDNVTDVPEIYRQAIKMLVGHYYENREAVNVGGNVTELPLAVADLLGIDRGGFF